MPTPTSTQHLSLLTYWRTVTCSTYRPTGSRSQRRDDPQQRCQETQGAHSRSLVGFLYIFNRAAQPCFVVQRCEVQCRSKAVGQCSAVQQLFMLLVVLLTAGAGCCYWPHWHLLFVIAAHLCSSVCLASPPGMGRVEVFSRISSCALHPLFCFTFSAGCLRLSHFILSWLCAPLTPCSEQVACASHTWFTAYC
jgi:hypothetical protein